MLQIVDKQKKTGVGVEPDSHLCEMAVSDALLYIVRYFDTFMRSTEEGKKNDNYADDVELLLSEYKL